MRHSSAGALRRPNEQTVTTTAALRLHMTPLDKQCFSGRSAARPHKGRASIA